jgi:hypothetical protein
MAIRQGLLPDHLLNDVPNDRQLELFMAVRFVHQKNPGRQEGQTNHRKQEKAEKADWNMHHGGNHGEHEAKDDVNNPHGYKTDVECDGLSAVKFDERPFVDQQENQSGDPTENVAE